ncbi:hypothetical protein SAMN05421504_109232 [Amycolatopsis xylanica]|uniref:Lipoprotein n=1 Tax=Amycolatopsis xylanica TaxID=589385 RepID=A0A1H3QBV2_9PSEU|nr:hypothetical protein [Amycolatopsis xylanica]SDZ10753.1 hypothetical protein SAMN05421504_109232 [Amycolatopsis xylanica]
MTFKWVPPLLLLAACGSGGGGLPAAADGTNLAACSDGSCEVLVKTGDRIPNQKLGPVLVTVKEDRVEVSGGINVSLSASGIADRTLNLNGESFKIIAVKDGQAVVKVGKP